MDAVHQIRARLDRIVARHRRAIKLCHEKKVLHHQLSAKHALLPLLTPARPFITPLLAAVATEAADLDRACITLRFRVWQVEGQLLSALNDAASLTSSPTPCA